MLPVRWVSISSRDEIGGNIDSLEASKVLQPSEVSQGVLAEVELLLSDESASAAVGVGVDEFGFRVAWSSRRLSRFSIVWMAFESNHSADMQTVISLIV